MADTENTENRTRIPFWRVPWEFAVHGIVGTLIFAVIAVFAIGIDLAIQHWLEPLGISRVVIVGLEVAEYALFGTDLFLFLWFLWLMLWRTMKEL
jgi:hypothetical protein